MEDFNNICAVYDGGILSKIKIIELLSKLNPLEIYNFREYVEGLLRKSINDGFKPTKIKIEKYFQNIIASADESLDFLFEDSLVLRLTYSSTTISTSKNWILTINFEGLIDNEEYNLSVEILNLLKFKKLKETSNLKSINEVSQPFFNKKNMIKDIEYIIKLMDILKEPIIIESLSLSLNDKVEKIAITPNMFDHIIKMLLKHNGIWL